MRIALAQVNVTVGDIEGNLERCLDAVARAADAGAEIVLLPELALTGYPPEDLLAKAHFITAADRALKAFAERATVPALVGVVSVTGAGLHNAAALVAGGGVAHIYHKRELPNYGVFDEERYFEPGQADQIVRIGDARAALTVCEDVWIPATVQRVASQGAQMVLNISASPFHAGKGPEREAMLQARARDNGVWMAYCNLVGGQDELVFDGRSAVIAPDGTVVARGASFAEDVVIADVDVETGQGTGTVPPMAEGDEEIYRALETGLGDYVRKNGFTDVVLGLSGGIDSALVAVLAADALGPDRVHGVLMPGPYSSEGSITDAQALVHALGVKASELPIGATYEALVGTLGPVFAGHEPDVTEENLQARVRGALLMALSNKFGWLVLATGNKSELSVGYSTLYGDMAGGFSPIKDVFKTRVYSLARWRNTRGAVIPEASITKPPSAELRPDQTDQDSLPPYDVLDGILAGYIELDRSAEDLVQAGFDAATVARVVRMVDRAEYKRRQAAPGTRVTPKAFGRDRRMPITNRFGG
ncbi:MAG TPA: NAD+ synthase [Coriobacteriia bacterium]|nr:NAD+ synthase [Coriobacteriia bacterium]